MIPYKIESVFTRIPVANIVIVVFTTIFSFAIWYEYIPQSASDAMVLQDWDLGQMLSCTLIHGNMMHLFGNMLFLWIFGNAVCAAVGNITYPLLYLALAIISSIADLAFDGRPSIGASGAIGGIIGMAFILFPVNKVRTLTSFFFLPFTFSIKCFWMVAIWVIVDNILPVIQGGGHVAYWAHIGGFAGGMAAASILLAFKAVETYDPTFIDIITGRKLVRGTQSIYSLDEMVGAKEEKKPSYETGTDEPMLASPDPHLQNSEFKENTAPVFRVLNTMKKDQDLVCYFVNDGDPVHHLVVESSNPVGVQIHPTESLAKRSSGWLHVGHGEALTPKDISMVLSYDIGTGFKLTKTFWFEESSKRFVAA